MTAIKRITAWARRWHRFLTTPAQGPFWQEHHDR